LTSVGSVRTVLMDVPRVREVRSDQVHASPWCSGGPSGSRGSTGPVTPMRRGRREIPSVDRTAPAGEIAQPRRQRCVEPARDRAGWLGVNCTRDPAAPAACRGGEDALDLSAEQSPRHAERDEAGHQPSHPPSTGGTVPET
jgi:hypothetical protein